MRNILDFFACQPVIRSPSNAKFKALKNLFHSNRKRKSTNLAIIEGMHMAESAINANVAINQWILSEKILSEKYLLDFLELLKRYPGEEMYNSNSIIVLDDVLFSLISYLRSPEGIIGIFHPSPIQLPAFLNESIVILDAVQDPGNVGAILRTVAAAGIKHILAMQGTVHLWSPKVLRAAMGAHFHLHLYEDLVFDEIIRSIKIPFFVTTSIRGEYLGKHISNLFSLDLRKEIAWVFGNEGAGVSDCWGDYIDQLLTIPQTSCIDSLNVASSVAICLFEQKRQNSTNIS